MTFLKISRISSAKRKRASRPQKRNKSPNQSSRDHLNPRKKAPRFKKLLNSSISMKRVISIFMDIKRRFRIRKMKWAGNSILELGLLSSMTKARELLLHSQDMRDPGQIGGFIK